MAILAVDSGTTSTRVWLVEDGRVQSGGTARAGARDAVSGRNPDDLLAQVGRLARETLQRGKPATVEATVAFGMITSELGLEEVAHLTAPVGPREIAGAIVQRSYGDTLPSPVYLIPGVRCDGGDLSDTDVMRGEETEVIGLLAEKLVEPPFLYISTGSHTKFVYVDGEGRIAWSMTTLSGELIWALHRETILSDLVRPDGTIHDARALEDGARLAERLGLTRALFTARLMNRLQRASPARCSDFVHGAVAAQDLAALRTTLERHGVRSVRVAVGGASPFAVTYRHLLAREPWAANTIEVDEPLGAVGAWTLFRERLRLSEAQR
jgi:2-dehydro-3-deoxygalactonokinase